MSGCGRVFTSLPRVDQHLESDSCQANGSALFQSRNPRAPNSSTDGKSIKQITIEYFLSTVATIDIASHKEVHNLSQMNGPQLPDNLMMERNEVIEDWFGWGQRHTLKHPVTNPQVIEFLKWLFLRGNIKGKSKSAPFTMITLAAGFGTSNKVFDSEEYWKSAAVASGGEPIFKTEDIPEEWRVKQLISQFVAEMKKKKKKSELMTPEEKRIKLLHLLSITDPKHGPIPGDHELLADNLIGLEKQILQAISFACKQLDAKELSQSIESAENNNIGEHTEEIIDNINQDGIEEAFINDEQRIMDDQQYENEIEDDNDYVLLNTIIFSNSN